MKKTKTVTGNTESQKQETPPEPSPPGKTRQHGPQKEKVQLTVRIDKELMDRAYAQIKQDNARITDVLEEGLILALQQRDESMPRLTSQVRFLVANTTKQQQQQIRKFLGFLVMNETENLSLPDALWRKSILEYLDQIGPDRLQRALELYSRYGRTPEEITSMGSS